MIRSAGYIRKTSQIFILIKKPKAYEYKRFLHCVYKHAQTNRIRKSGKFCLQLTHRVVTRQQVRTLNAIQVALKRAVGYLLIQRYL